MSLLGLHLDLYVIKGMMKHYFLVLVRKNKTEKYQSRKISSSIQKRTERYSTGFVD
jgi:hypothetical protein